MLRESTNSNLHLTAGFTNSFRYSTLRPPPINPKFKIHKTPKSAQRSTWQDNSSKKESLAIKNNHDWKNKSPLSSIRPMSVRQMTTFSNAPLTENKNLNPLTTGLVQSIQDDNCTQAEASLKISSQITSILNTNECLKNPIHNSSNVLDRNPVVPDSLYLDQSGLKEFPILTSNDRHIKLLSLQHNSITRLNNLVVLSHLIVLDLYSNKIQRISGLEGFHNLRVLLLGKNRIRRIEGLDGLRRLEILDLHGNQLRYVDNLKSLTSLRVLNVAANTIRSIRNIAHHNSPSLVELNLKRNRIKKLYGLEKLTCLRKLLLSNNELEGIFTLEPLRKLSILEELVIESNPLCSDSDYKNKILDILPSLTSLDRMVVDDGRRVEVKIWQQLRLTQEEELRQAHAKLRESTKSSREEVINETRRRWESVKNYIRNNQTQIEMKTSTSVMEVERLLMSLSEEHQTISRQSYPEQICIKPNSIENSLAMPRNNSSVELDNFQKNEASEFNVTEEGKVLDSPCMMTNFEDTENTISKRSYKFEGCMSSKLTRVAIVRPVVRNHPMTNAFVTKVDQLQPSIRCASSGDEFYTHRQNQENVSTVSKDKISLTSRSDDVVDMSVTETYEKTQEKQVLSKDEQSKSLEEVGSQRVSTEGIKKSTLGKSSSCVIADKNISINFRDNSKNFNCTISTPISNSTVKNQVGTKEAENFDRFRQKEYHKTHRSQSIDIIQASASDSESIETSTNNSETQISARQSKNKKKFHLKPKQYRGHTAKASSCLSSPIITLYRRPMTGIQYRKLDNFSNNNNGGKILKRVDSFSKIPMTISELVKKQGSDYLVEIDGKTLSLYGQAALKHFLTGFPDILMENVTTIKFNFIAYENIVPFFGRLKHTYPMIENIQFRANNLCILSQFNALADLQGLQSLHIYPDGNPIIGNPLWKDYAIYRLAHWGLKQIDGNQIFSEYHGNKVNEESKIFETFGYLALSCLPQEALTPLAKKLHRLQFFCCCSQSSSSDDLGRNSGPNGVTDSSDSICNSWHDDPVLVDVIGKEALVYTPATSGNYGASMISPDMIASNVIIEGCDMLRKLKMLEKLISDLIVDAVEDILIDYSCMNDFSKQEITKLKNSNINSK